MSTSFLPPTGQAPEAPVEVVPYDDSWPNQFEAERVLLESALRKWLMGPIEHIGSTSIPSLPAKPVIDIMAPVRTLDASLPAIEALSSLDYMYYPYKPESMHWFCKPSPSYRTHHLHLIPHKGNLWNERLAFRDALRQNSMLASDYARLKLQLATQFRFDREAYTEAKSPFVLRVLSQLQNNGHHAT
jgi:GrpB-like predicted nucleotidyltransferase (UPF0157 family)